MQNMLLLAVDVSVSNLYVYCFEELLDDMENMQYPKKAASHMFHSIFLKGAIIMFSLDKNNFRKNIQKVNVKIPYIFFLYVYIK